MRKLEGYCGGPAITKNQKLLGISQLNEGRINACKKGAYEFEFNKSKKNGLSDKIAKEKAHLFAQKTGKDLTLRQMKAENYIKKNGLFKQLFGETYD